MITGCTRGTHLIRTGHRGSALAWWVRGLLRTTPVNSTAHPDLPTTKRRGGRFVIRCVDPRVARPALVVESELAGDVVVRLRSGSDLAFSHRAHGEEPSLVLGQEPPFLRVRVEGETSLEMRGVRFREVLIEGGEELSLGDARLRFTRTTEEDEPTRFGGMVGTSVPMLAAFASARELARSHVPFFVVGEPWTGRRGLVQAVHDQSSRAHELVRVVSCSSLSAGELAMALSSTRKAGGLLVLHDVGALQTDAREVVRAMLASPNKDARGRIACTFTVHHDAPPKADLCPGFDSLGVATLVLPPFRDRRSDAFELAQVWWASAGRRDALPAAVATQLATSLLVDNAEDVRALVLHEAALSAQRQVDRHAFVEARRRTLEEFELRYVAGALQRAGGNVTRASAASGLTRRYFHELMARAKRVP